MEGLSTIGLIGVLIKAKERKLIESVMPVVQELESQSGFWLGEQLKLTIRRLVKSSLFHLNDSKFPPLRFILINLGLILPQFKYHYELPY